jgi:HK97 gp10 family phage protein
MTVRIKGREKYQRQLRRLGEDVAAAARPVLARNANELANAVRRDVPVDEADLKQTVAAYVVPESKGIAWRVVEGARRATGGDGFYATFQEFGTSQHRPQPHFFPNYRRLRARFRSRLSTAIRKALKARFGLN